KACERHGFSLRLAERELCTDNAAMIGILGELKLQKGQPALDPDEEIRPSWSLTEGVSR
ncbi:MAG: tRNA N6-adenosine threonylcarbamoyltransferase, partial [Verrucomicrobiales bacterium]|nr:tRNA N6-adenosine threonylcarbamoyltransferase [Verrucomicrobiales bacterium]